eukprot:3917278-Lingulodinium_polyedra.AAC.1
MAPRRGDRRPALGLFHLLFLPCCARTAPPGPSWPPWRWRRPAAALLPRAPPKPEGLRPLPG